MKDQQQQHNRHDFLHLVKLHGDEDRYITKMGRMSRRCMQTSLLLWVIAVTGVIGLSLLQFTNSGLRSSIVTERSLESAGPNGETFNIAFYNIDLQNKMKAGFLSHDKYPAGEGPVIATLVSKRVQDIEELQTALKSLAFLKGDKDYNALAPVLVFNEGDLDLLAIKYIVSSTNRPIAFPRVDFKKFPDGFNEVVEEAPFPVPGRDPWGYVQMIRFWTTMVWRHPAVKHFDTVMRIDSDSCFKEVNDYLPNFKTDDLYYHSQYVGVEPKGQFIDGMFDFVTNWMDTTKQPSQARNYLLWHYGVSVWKNDNTLPLFRTNFELAKVEFMQRGDVARFNEALTEKEPFGVLRKRWGDAVLRFLTMAIFVDNDKIMTIKPAGYYHKQGCSKEEVEEALYRLANNNS